MNNILKEELIDFENWCVEEYHQGNIRSPVHLSGSIDGNLEEELIEIFKKVKPQDFIFTTYRSHYHALLKGMPKERLKKWILDNKSMHVMDKEHKIVSTAIVGGQLSQAVGCAMAIKRKVVFEIDEEKEIVNDITPHVWVFCGDACAETGTFSQMTKFAARNDLPISFICESNNLSTDTPTQESWGIGKSSPDIKRIEYIRSMPHYGSPRGRVDFDKLNVEKLT